jgi:hypothetical protein
MLGEILAIVAIVSSDAFAIVCFAIMLGYQQRKPLGMRTLLDLIIRDLIIVSLMNLTIFTVVILISLTVAPIAIPSLSFVLNVLAYFISAVLIIEVLFVAITRHLSIYYGMMLNDVNDNTMLVSCRIVNLIFCAAMVIYDVMYHNGGYGRVFQVILEITVF